jgi:hypothetical protein
MQLDDKEVFVSSWRKAPWMIVADFQFPVGVQGSVGQTNEDPYRL